MMNARIFSEAFNRLIEPIKNRLMLMINRATVDIVDDSGSIQSQQVKVLAGETKSKVPSVHQFGFSSNPPPGSDAIMISVNGNRENSVIIGHENREFRFTNLEEGDSIQYNKEGKFVHVKGKNVEMLLEKLIINNDDHELVDKLSEYMDRVNNGYILTAIGPQPWVVSTKTLLDATKDDFDTFKD